MGALSGPLVSIVMPSHNSASFIHEAVLSVIQQSFADWELIVVDDKSTDASAGIVAGLAARDPRIFLLRNEKNQGAARSRQRALDLARGRFVAFLDADDAWHPRKLEVQLAHMRQRNAAISHCSYTRVDAHGNVLGDLLAQRSINYRQLLGAAHVGCLTVMYDRVLTGEVSIPVVKLRSDYATWLSILRRGHVMVGIDEILATYRVHSASLSGNKMRAATAQWNIYRNVERIPLPLSLWYFAIYALRAVGRRVREVVNQR